MDDIISMIVIILLLLMGSAFFSASETALTGANRVRLKSQEEQGSRPAKRAGHLIDQFESSLTALLIGNNIVNTLLASLATVFCAKLFNDSGVGIATAAVTVLIVVFGEVTPKTYAGAHSEETIKRFAPFILAIKVLFFPLIAALRKLQKLMLPKAKSDPSVTEDEFRVLFDQGVDEGVLEEDRSELLQNALEFDDISAEDILTPRVELSAVELGDSRETVQEVFLTQHFTRLPVYEDDVDHILGVISQKDFFAAIVTGKYTDLRALLQPCLYVPPKKKIAELMPELQRRRMHVAVVTDEYGGTRGIVTLEDILEQLVGDIWDEHDLVTSPIRPLGAGNDRWEVDGEADVEELYDTTCEQDPPETDAVTVAGLGLEILGHIPTPGETFICGRLKFVVTRADELRILQLYVTLLPEETPSAGKSREN